MKKNCYVILPDNRYAQEAMTEIYEPAILESGNLLSFSPQTSNSGNLMKTWWSNLREADIVLVHLDGLEEGVIYQLGMAHSLSVPVVLVAPTEFKVPKHLINSKIIHYDPKSPRWVAHLASELQDKLKTVSESPESSIELNLGIGNEPASSPIFKKGKLLNLKNKLNAQYEKGRDQPNKKKISLLQSEIKQLKKELTAAKEVHEAPIRKVREPIHLEELPEGLEKRVESLLSSGASKLDIYRYLRDRGYSNSESFEILEEVEKRVL